MNQSTTTFAMTAAALFAAACGGSQAPAEGASSEAATESAQAPVTSTETVKCLGIHECKGKSVCGVEGGHACAGQNDCKGKGWIKVSLSECDEKGGTVL
jgi:hypothetical protein